MIRPGGSIAPLATGRTRVGLSGPAREQRSVDAPACPKVLTNTPLTGVPSSHSGAQRSPGNRVITSSGKEVNHHMTRLYALISSLFVRDEEGQGLAEYALILSLIAVVAIVSLVFLGGNVSKLLSTVGKSV